MIKIVTDSTCDLPERVIAEHNITVIPLYINVDDESYLDGVELSRQEFYQRLPHYNETPTTSAPSPGMFSRVYQRLAAQGASAIVSIHISASLSNTVNVARLTAQETKEVPVTVFDAGQISLGTGLATLMAAKAAAAGRSVTDIMEMLKEKMQHTYTLAGLDTLEFLRRSGRLTRFQSSLGAVLRIKPLLTMNGGEAGMEKVRTRKRAFERLIELISDLAPLEHLSLVHTHAPEAVETLRQMARDLFPAGEEPMLAEVTPVIGSHIGPGAAGFVCVSAKD
ncbi:MAG: DegV family protein, partial [Anaerolineae bacterium]|nr:DegV family protein [Anaerolineae bacterium]